MKVSELSGKALDYAVSTALGYSDWDEEFGFFTVYAGDYYGAFWLYDFNPSTHWEDAGFIIEDNGIGIQKRGDVWDAWIPFQIKESGVSPLIAAMRCYVVSVLGDDVFIPNLT